MGLQQNDDEMNWELRIENWELRIIEVFNKFSTLNSQLSIPPHPSILTIHPSIMVWYFMNPFISMMIKFPLLTSIVSAL